jgi:hypothetical protein
VMDHPSFVGAHWFQYTDQPLTGRTLDGENYNAYKTIAFGKRSNGRYRNRS